MMPIQPPRIDGRDRQALLRDLQALIPFYTPQWRIGEAGPGRALVESFLLFQREVLARLNGVPDKLFLAFLDRLGLSLLPALPARAPVSFTLAQGSTSAATVPANTQVAAGDVVFETQAALVATPAALKAVYGVVAQQDLLIDHLPGLATPGTALFFTLTSTQPNLQEHSLYLGDPNLFNLKAAGTIALVVQANQAELLGSAAVRWQWWGKLEAAGATDDWNAFESVVVEPTDRRSEARILLTKAEGEVKERDINGIKSRWLRCLVTGPLRQGDPLADLRLSVSSVAPAQVGLVPDLAFANDIPLPLPPSSQQPLLPFGIRPRQSDTFSLASQEVLSKKGARITLTISSYPGGVTGLPIDRVYGIGRNFRERLQAAGVNTTTDLMRRTPEQIAEFIRNRVKDIPASRYVTRARNMQEAAAKQYYDKTVTRSEGEEGVTLPAPRLSWEYWNGQGWVVLPDVEDLTSNLLAPGTLTFTCPEDLATTTVGGQENYWIRVRIASGDYGQEKFRFNGDTWETDTTDIHPPQLSSLTLAYDVEEGQAPAAIVSRNNLQYVIPQETPFAPFMPLDDMPPTLYLGFDRPLLNGPFSFLIALEEQEYPQASRPRIVWEYSRTQMASPWGRLNPDDGTVGLTRSGIVTFLGPPDATLAPYFGQQLFWIRAVDAENRFGQVPVPHSTGIYLNAVWVVQTESIQDERFGSSDGTAGQSFRLARAPVVSVEVWVNELGALSEEEIAQLQADPTQVEEESDLAGNRLALWVRWHRLDDLALSGRDERAYLLDAVQGLIQFGDGIQGRVPPVGRENLKADYQVGGGSAGNVAAGQINTVKSGVPRIDKVTNPLAAAGGADAESTTSVTERGPQLLKHRDRATTKEDYERLAHDASRAVAKARCLPNFDDERKFHAGWVTVMIVPTGTEPQPTPTPTLKEQVHGYLAARAPNVVTGPQQLVVAGPTYLRCSVEVDLYPTSLDVAAIVEQTALLQLSSFFHPLTGGFDEGGWAFGQLPCLSDVLALLHGIDGVDHLERISMQIADAQGVALATLRMDAPEGFVAPPYTMVCSGEHRIHLKGI